jgi:hypothetical protein
MVESSNEAIQYEMKRPNGQSSQILAETKEEKDLGSIDQ